MSSELMVKMYQFDKSLIEQYLSHNHQYFLLSGKPGDKLKLVSVKFDPDPPVKGKNVSVNAQYTLGMIKTSVQLPCTIYYRIICT